MKREEINSWLKTQLSSGRAPAWSGQGPRSNLKHCRKKSNRARNIAQLAAGLPTMREAWV